MISRLLPLLLAASVLFSTSGASAGEPVSKPVADKLRAALENPAMGLKVSTVETSQVDGLYEVQFENGPMVYATPAGDHFILGDLFAVQDGGFVNLAEQRRDGERAEKLAAIDRSDMIIFSPEGKPRASIAVFTDATCFYCQKLHNEVPELNKRGVEVRYLAYPRGGIGSDGYKQLATAWCAKNPQDTLTRLKNREQVPENVCKENPVAAQYQLGQEMGVRGTPAMVTGTGQMIPGYQSADELMITLGLEK
jgi:thiol:disulfide interchange protein DsbC